MPNGVIFNEDDFMSYKRDFQVKIDICYFLKKIFDFFKKFF
jgi:hypothetical protein